MYIHIYICTFIYIDIDIDIWGCPIKCFTKSLKKEDKNGRGGS